MNKKIKIFGGKKKKNRSDNFLTLNDYKLRSAYQRFAYKPKINKLNFVLGSLFVAYGAITILLPTGSWPMIFLGLFLIACPISIKKLILTLINDIKFYLGVMF